MAIENPTVLNKPISLEPLPMAAHSLSEILLFFAKFLIARTFETLEFFEA
jgi:hypothetical protein